ncbi:hypothetical protein CBM2615_A200004 [Cupriavidus taiwanensis]|nr:hypothetical protein CBM2615_A200004 [Cupriavidus taiwanensis]
MRGVALGLRAPASPEFSFLFLQRGT